MEEVVVTEQPLSKMQKGPVFDLLVGADRLVFRFPSGRRPCCCEDEYKDTTLGHIFQVFAIGSSRQLGRRSSSQASFTVVQEFRCPDCLCDVDMWASLCCCAEDCFAMLMSCFIPPARKPFLYDLLNDDTKTSVVRIDKPYRCLWPYQGPICCYGCSCTRICQDEIFIEAPSGNFIGRVLQHNCCQEFPYLSVHDNTGKQVLSVGQPTNWCSFCGCRSSVTTTTKNNRSACAHLCLCVCGPYRLALATCLTGCCMGADDVIELELYDVYRTDKKGNITLPESAVGSISKIIKPKSGCCSRPQIEFEIRFLPELDINERASIIGSFLLLFNTTEPVARISRE